MKKNFTLKAMALAAMMVMTGTAQAASAKASTGDLVISKVYYAGTKDPNNKNYKADQYLEIMNNKHKVVDVAGLYIGVLETEGSTGAYTAEYLSSDEAGDLKDKVICKQIFRIPATTPVYLEPGKTLIITNSAVDHTVINSNGHDLSGADFEVKTTNSGYSQHNENVAALEMTYSFNASTDFINFTNSGPCGFVLIATAAESQVNAAIAAPIYAKGKEKGSQYVAIPAYRVIDGVDILKKNASTGEVDATTKRLVSSVDKGYVTTETASLWNGETVYRRTALHSEDRVIVYDTNDSNVDWAASATIQPRAFDTEAYGTTDLPVVIPASGFLPIKPAKPFFGPKELAIVGTNVSSQATVTDITYNTYRADTLLAMASPYILVGNPGSYTLKMSDAAATISGSSNSNWTDEAGVFTISQNNRLVYKFVCGENRVGFQRDENYKDVNYKSCVFEEGEHFFITIPTKAVGYIETNRGMETGTLSFLEWTGPTPTEVAVKGIRTDAAERVQPADNAIFDLSGRRVSKAVRGLYIIGGKKVVVK